MIDLPYSRVIEATKEPDFFGFYSPELEGFSGIGHLPPANPNPTMMIQNEAKDAA